MADLVAFLGGGRLVASVVMAVLAHVGVALTLPGVPAVHAEHPEDFTLVDAPWLEMEPTADLGSSAPTDLSPPTVPPMQRDSAPSRARAVVAEPRLMQVPLAGPGAALVPVSAASVNPDAGEVTGLAQAPAARGPSTESSTHGARGSLGGDAPGRARGAKLLARGDPCAGYFPASSATHRALVRLMVHIDANGGVTRSQVLSVTPPGREFSQAAMACASRLRFSAATSEEGTSMGSVTTLLLHFERP